MKSVADQYFCDRSYNRFFTSRGKSNGTEKIERYLGSLKRGTRTLLLESGFDDQFYFDAAHTFCVHYNSLPTEANKINCKVAPFETLGLKVDIKALHPDR